MTESQSIGYAWPGGRLRWRACLLAAMSLAASLGLATAAEARKLTASCGQVLTKPGLYVLQNDVGPCSSNGLTLAANNIKLDLNRHTVSGQPLVTDADGKATGGFGEGAGIQVVGRNSNEIRNGTVRYFDAGVLLVRSETRSTTNSKVTNLNVTSNVGRQVFGEGGGNQSDFSDGIALLGATGNTIESNTLTDNGSRAIGLIDGADDNGIMNNRITGNRGQGVGMLSFNSRNVVHANTVTGNRSTGINIAFDNLDNKIHHNTVDSNGRDGIRTSVNSANNEFHDNIVTNNTRSGIAFDFGNDNRAFSNKVVGNTLDGIRIGGGDALAPTFGNEVSENDVQSNGRNGIVITCTQDENFALPSSVCISYDQRNEVLDNASTGNGTGELLVSGPRGLIGSFDLLDGNTSENPNYPAGAPECDNNTWKGNTFNTAFPDCTKG